MLSKGQRRHSSWGLVTFGGSVSFRDYGTVTLPVLSFSSGSFSTIALRLAMFCGSPMPNAPFPAVRAMLFDIGNVLLRFDFKLALDKLASLSEVGDAVQVMAQIDRVKLAYEDGQIQRAAFLRAAFDVLRFRGTEADFIAAWEDIFEPSTPMVALVEQLHGSLPLYLLSNTNDIHIDYIRRRYEFFGRFDGGVFSHEARASKPGREIFEIVCRQCHLEPASTFFIDDLLPNIETARALGFQCHHYHHERHGELIAQLQSAGVL
jgi:putative hydrolase of the HAD superfamily